MTFGGGGRVASFLEARVLRLSEGKKDVFWLEWIVCSGTTLVFGS